MNEAEEIITWAECQAISEGLIAAAKNFEDSMYQEFLEKQGLYILCYDGIELGGSLWGEPEPPIIYIGRIGPDSARHWRDNTGKSTVRRSLAAMLANTLSLQSIPGSEDPNDNDRYMNYRLTAESEDRLTEWMKANIKVAFWELGAGQVEPNYLALINCNTPKLNFQGNPHNTFGQQIKSYRKILAAMAMTYDNQNNAGKQ
ncbi:MAG: hypothetical protein GX572_03905 [Clostridia bacterium]|nr:hypothetical protein [Clostridia bacterium]